MILWLPWVTIWNHQNKYISIQQFRYCTSVHICTKPNGKLQIRHHSSHRDARSGLKADWLLWCVIALLLPVAVWRSLHHHKDIFHWALLGLKNTTRVILPSLVLFWILSLFTDFEHNLKFNASPINLGYYEFKIKLFFIRNLPQLYICKKAVIQTESVEACILCIVITSTKIQIF